MSEELKACPFCGNHVEMVNTKTYPNFERSPAYMKCKTCNYYIAAFDDENLINRWNTRPIEGAMQAEIDRLIELQRKMPLVADRRGAELSDLRAQHTRLIDQCKRLADEICGYVGADGNAPGSAELSNFKHLMKELDV